MILPLLSIGVIGGVFAGLFGVGGGLVMVPLAVSWLGVDQRSASAISLLAIIPTAAVSAALYGSRGQIDLFAGGLLAIGALVGAPLGAAILRRISLVWLKWLFIAGLVATAVRLVIVAPERTGALEYGPITIIGLVALGLAMGLLAGLLGVGGGIIAVPVLITVFGVGDLVAKGTSLLAMIPGAITGTASNARAGMLPVREGLVIGATAAVSSLVGVAIAFWIPPVASSWMFATLILWAIVQTAIRRTGPAKPPLGGPS